MAGRTIKERIEAAYKEWTGADACTKKVIRIAGEADAEIADLKAKCEALEDIIREESADHCAPDGGICDCGLCNFVNETKVQIAREVKG